MNVLTHGLASLALARAAWPRAPKQLWIVAVATGVIADIDSASAWWGASAYLRWHRTYTHSLFASLVLAAAFAADARAAVNVWRNNFDSVLQSAVARKRAYENAGRALQLNPDLSLPYAMLAILQVVDERYEEAIESARRAVALGPGDVEAHVALGYVYLYAGKLADAAAAIEARVGIMAKQLWERR